MIMLTNEKRLKDKNEGPTLSKLWFFEDKIISRATMEITLNLGIMLVYRHQTPRA